MGARLTPSKRCYLAFIDALPRLKISGEDHPFHLSEDDFHQGSVLKFFDFVDVEFGHGIVREKRRITTRSAVNCRQFTFYKSPVKKKVSKSSAITNGLTMGRRMRRYGQQLFRRIDEEVGPRRHEPLPAVPAPGDRH